MEKRDRGCRCRNTPKSSSRCQLMRRDARIAVVHSSISTAALSVFNEIIAEQQREALEKGNAHKSHHSRVGMIQGTARSVDTAHRSRLMAFEQVAHSGNDGRTSSTRTAWRPCLNQSGKAFVTKVLGIVSFQMMLMVSIICIIKYTGLGEAILEGYSMWSLLTTFIPLLILGVLFGVMQEAPLELDSILTFHRIMGLLARRGLRVHEQSAVYLGHGRHGFQHSLHHGVRPHCVMRQFQLLQLLTRGSHLCPL